MQIIGLDKVTTAVIEVRLQDPPSNPSDEKSACWCWSNLILFFLRPSVIFLHTTIANLMLSGMYIHTDNVVHYYITILKITTEINYVIIIQIMNICTSNYDNNKSNFHGRVTRFAWSQFYVQYSTWFRNNLCLAFCSIAKHVGWLVNPLIEWCFFPPLAANCVPTH